MNIIVIGGTSGIGKALTDILLKEGAQVWVLSRTTHPEQSSANLHYIIWDAVKDEWPAADLPSVVDGLAYCPGTVLLKPFHRITEAEFLSDLQINVMGAIKCLQSLLPALKLAPAPSVVLFSTVAVQTGMNFHSSIAISKGAVEGLTRSLAVEWAPRIRVNAIAPSLVQTPLTARLTATEEKVQASANKHLLGRIGQPDDVAAMAAFLLSEKSSWITGQIFHVDGGVSR